MNSPAVGLYDQADLGERLATVLEASRAIRSKSALTVGESRKLRLAARESRIDGWLTNRVMARRQAARLWLARAIANALSEGGYPAFVVTAPQETASHQ